MPRVLQLLQKYFGWLYDKWTYRDRVTVTSVRELPAFLKSKRLYIIGGERPWAAAMLCPSGCGEIIHLSLLDSDSPSWKVRVIGRAELPTVLPSIWRTRGCRSHFHLRNGKIHWCKT